ncbi:MAG TPA: metallophosphoesterase [Chryseolinea sp.]|nr:metallophosphoesterase [Chryseolinea sp.]HPM32038.1 metallophosphoesterase [Chryseolinea sp.]
MKSRMMTFFIVTALFLLIDYYVFQAILMVSKEWSPLWKNFLRYGFWIPTVLSIAAMTWWTFGDPYASSAGFRNWMLTGLVSVYFSKLFAVVILFIDDIYRGIKWLANFFYKGTDGNISGEGITRSEFLSKTALVAAAIPFGTMAYGIISGAHDYRVKHLTVKLPNLPKSFDGIKLAQISDIHSGSFFNKTAVKGGVEMLMNEKPDLIFFTGDLVNNETSEVRDYIDIFNKVKAPLGVYSVTGNHDYGDYKPWATEKAKQSNFKDLVEAHKIMGFDILMNEHRFVEIGGEKIAILGNENWGGGRFAKYGKLDQAYNGTEEAAIKLLLSHDPSHWDAQVRKLYPDIDIMFAGHTHGFQFGVEIGDFKWSPSQYAYKQWAGLYQEDNQYLYVNRGFGYLGYPGRIGMPPELTIIELKRA